MSDTRNSKEEKEEIIVHDRRLLTEEERQGKVNLESEEPAAQPSEEKEEKGKTEEAPKEGAETPTADVDVGTLVQFFISELSARAWIHMGLLQNPITKLVVKDLPQARLAIDCVAALVEKLRPQLEDKEKRQYDSLLNDLRLNFIQQSGA